MKRISAAIIQPTVIALGSSIFLYSYNRELRFVDYFVHLPFWITVVRPSGLYWNSKLLKQVNKGVFPPEMKVYRQMYLASKNAILYDVVLNHALYHSILTPILLSYMFVANSLIKNTKLDVRKNTIAQNKSQENSLTYILKQSFMTLLQGRAIISCFSILSEYWISYFSLKRAGTNQNFALSTGTKRFLLAKEMLLSWSWTGLILKEFYRNYWKVQPSQTKENLSGI